VSLSKTVLIVEDDAGLRRLYSGALRLAGFDVLESGDGLSALQLLETHRPDCIVLDLMLPRLSGYAVSQEIEMSAEMRDIPIVVVTGSVADTTKLAADCVLRKPASPEELIAVVERCMQRLAARADAPNPSGNRQNR